MKLGAFDAKYQQRKYIISTSHMTAHDLNAQTLVFSPHFILYSFVAQEKCYQSVSKAY